MRYSILITAAVLSTACGKADNSRVAEGELDSITAHSSGVPPHADSIDTNRPLWLDTDLVNWNMAGAGIPTAPMPEEAGTYTGRCQAAKHEPISIHEKEIARGGWNIVAPSTTDKGVTIVTAASDADGMCRPWNYQMFVFTAEKFAGTLSPTTMDSRIDGAGWGVDVTSGNGDTAYVNARYNRYKEDDALCCPSSESVVRFEIVKSAANPVLKPISVETKLNPKQ